GHVAGARIAVGCVGPTPRRMRDAEALLVGRPVAASSAALAEAGRAAGRAADAVTDLHGSADYKAHLVGVLVRRAGREALAARGSGDATYCDLAEKALARALELRPDVSTAAGVTALLGVVQFARHDFQEARRSAQRAVAAGPDGLFAYTLIGDASVELGDYE